MRAKTGVEPSQVVDWLSLIGDSVDNIPGVPGVGPKTAAELLNQFGSVETLYARLDGVKSEKLRAALRARRTRSGATANWCGSWMICRANFRRTTWRKSRRMPGGCASCIGAGDSRDCSRRWRNRAARQAVLI